LYWVVYFIEAHTKKNSSLAADDNSEFWTVYICVYMRLDISGAP